LEFRGASDLNTGAVSGTRVRRITREYLGGTTCSINRICNKIANEKVFEGNGTTQVAQTDYVYDEYSLTVRSGSPPGHDGSSSQSGRANLTTVKRYKTSSTYTVEHFKYDNLGNMIEQIDPLNRSTLIDFTDNFTDTSQNGSTFAFPKRVTNALSQYTQTKYDFNTGLPKVSTNLRGYDTTTVYDIMNRVTE
jgi:YD repeat-containing protein